MSYFFFNLLQEPPEFLWESSNEFAEKFVEELSAKFLDTQGPEKRMENHLVNLLETSQKILKEVLEEILE